MNNRDRILKYLSDLMSSEEKIRFQEELENNKSLKKELERIEKEIHNFSTETNFEIESPYFNNLYVRAKDKFKTKRHSKKLVALPALSIVFTVLLLFILNFPDRDRINSQNLSLQNVIAEVDSTEILEMFESNFIDDYAFYQSGDFSEYINSENEEDIYLVDGYNNEINFYPTTLEEYDDLSNEDVDIIYDELLNKKIL